jgi:acyl-coenzyme A synthetase/AMP-(fatty) acid ligase
MIRTPMPSYNEGHDSFRWDIPLLFNFGADVVDWWAAHNNKLALIWCNETGAERQLTFSDISEYSNRFASLLGSMGIRRGDRVMILLPRIPEWQIAMIGCMKLGAIPIPGIEMLTKGDIAYRVKHSGARGAVTTVANISKFEGLGSLLARVSVGGGADWVDFEEGMARSAASFVPVWLEAEDPAIIYYTSGSAGKPKGVTHANRAIFSWRVSAWYWQQLTEADTIWCTADTGWSKSGTSILFAPWSCGSTVLFYDGRFDAKKRFDLLEKYRVTVFCAAATELRRLILEKADAYDLSALRLAVSAGETVNPEIIGKWTELIKIPLLDGYGQTETLMTIVNYPVMPVKPGSMGRPLPGTEIVILNEKNEPVEAGKPGRLMIKLPNPQMMLGYWGDPALTQSAIVRYAGADWFDTSDVVLVDQDEYVFYLGRSDDVINSAGYRIGPLEVENAVLEHPDVQECAAVSSPDPQRGEIVKAFVVLRAGIPASEMLAKEIQEHVKRVTAPYKYPRKIEFVTDLPKTPTGKIQRRLLREQEYKQAGLRNTL